MAIDTSKQSQGKETYNFVINSIDKVSGAYNYNCIYNVDWDSLLRHFPTNQKFRLKWSLGSRDTATHSGDHNGTLYIDFGVRTNQQDSKLNNQNSLMGFAEFVDTGTANAYFLRHSYENTYVTITKPINSQIGVKFRLVDNSALWNGSTMPTDNLPNYVIKIELQPINEE